MLEIRHLYKDIAGHPILKDIDFKVEAGEFVVLVGPSGCGKSTLLRTVAGLEAPTKGDIWINDRNATKDEPQNRDVAMVFQNYALYPHLNVYENIAFGLKVRKFPGTEIEKRVRETAELLKIDSLLQRKPKELSGGQRQRVALGRALARKAPVLLFDEPLSNLDAHLRQEMRFEIKRLHQELKNTVLYVTHDQSEALTLGHRIVVMNQGHVEQMDSPLRLYHEPANKFVAQFIGSPEMNFIEGQIQEGFLKGPNLPMPGVASSQGPVTLGIRPEDLRLASKGWPFKVEFYEDHGSYGLYHGVIGSGAQGPHKKLDGNALKAQKHWVVLGRKEDRSKLPDFVDFDLTKIHLFDTSTGKRL